MEPPSSKQPEQTMKPNSGGNTTTDEEQSVPKHYSIAASFASGYSEESDSTKILGTPYDSHASLATIHTQNSTTLSDARKKAIQEYKAGPQFQQYAREINRRDEELARNGEKIEVSKEPQRIYDAMQRQEKRKRMLKYLIPIILLLVLIVVPIVVLVSAEHEKENEREEQGIEIVPEYEPLVCEDEFALCDFEKEKICTACSCIVSINTNDGGEQVDEADRFKFKFITVADFAPQGINATVARETILSSDTCLVCVDDRSTADCVSGVLGGVTVDCCADLLGENTKEYEEESDTIEESEESASSLNAIRHNKY
eukprot:maker-scaffold_8-snap-gene-14.17-mRNA-1 protein AED:0.10 eAED:0.10 QI:252/1/1/1/1/1/2/97/312